MDSDREGTNTDNSPPIHRWDPDETPRKPAALILQRRVITNLQVRGCGSRQTLQEADRWGVPGILSRSLGVRPKSESWNLRAPVRAVREDLQVFENFNYQAPNSHQKRNLTQSRMERRGEGAKVKTPTDLKLPLSRFPLFPVPLSFLQFQAQFPPIAVEDSRARETSSHLSGELSRLE
jgi:hypothetical protein